MNRLIDKLKLGSITSTNYIQDKFDELASILLEHSIIKKGQDMYIPRDIEFYYYSSKHMDIITYPRNSIGGEWFFHDSGVDLSFESNIELRPDKKGTYKPFLTDSSSFGGILIRAVDQVDNMFQIRKRILGPKNVMFELFDQFNALSTPLNFPILTECEHKLGSARLIEKRARHNLLPVGKDAKTKVSSIIKYNYIGIDNNISTETLIEKFNEYLDAPYHYTSLD